MQQVTDDQTGDHHHGEHPVPVHQVQQLGGEDRRQRQTEQRHGGLLDAQVAAMPTGMGCLQRRHDARRRVGALGDSDHRADQHQADQPRRQAAESGQQGEDHHCRHDDRAMAETVGQLAHEQRGGAPGDGQHPGDQAEVLIGQLEVLHDHREQRHDHEAVDADQAEAQRQQEDGLPLVGSIRTMAQDFVHCRFHCCSCNGSVPAPKLAVRAGTVVYSGCLRQEP
ncbi:hypothetical protein D3C78_1186630 [compost metagenome]